MMKSMEHGAWSTERIVRCVGTAALFLLASCSKEDLRFPPYDNTAEVEAAWKAKPDLYRFKTAADLPKDLKWEGDHPEYPDMGDPAAKKGGTFSYDMGNFPPTLRITGPDASNNFRSEHFDNVELGLVGKHLNLDKWIPCLAKEWAISDDRRTVYYRLNPEATYSDGVKVAVEDYFMQFYISLSKYVQDPYTNDYFTKEYEAITKYDDHTMSITLKDVKPDPLLTSNMNPMPRHFYREFGDDFPARYQWRKMPTTGAYDIKPEDVKFGRSITLTRVKNWWAKDKKYYRYRFNADRMSYRLSANMDTVFELFRQGKIDHFYSSAQLLPPNYWYDKGDIPELLNGYIERYSFYNEFPRLPRCLYLNQAKPFLDNQDVRTGLSYAMDMDKVISVVLRGDAQRMQSAWSGYGRFVKPDLKALPYDPVKAQEHFAKVGFTKRNAKGVLENAEGKLLKFTVTIPNSSLFTQAALIWKEGALKAGVDFEIESIDFTQLGKKMREKEHEIVLIAFGSEPPYPHLWEYFHSENAWEKNADGSYVLKDGKKAKKVDTNNLTMTDNPELDKLIDQERKAPNEDEKQKLCWQIQEIVQKSCCQIPTWEVPMYRYFHWRWMRWPKDGNLKITREALDAFVWWIDDDIKAETQQAMRDGKSFGEVSRVFDQYRSN